MYFVVANKEYLEGFSICCPSADSLMVEGYRRIWVGDQKFIKNGKDASGLSRMAYGGRPIIR